MEWVEIIKKTHVRDWTKKKRCTDEQRSKKSSIWTKELVINDRQMRTANTWHSMALMKLGKAFLPAWRCSLRLRLKQQEISTSSKRMTVFLRYKGHQKQYLKSSSEMTRIHPDGWWEAPGHWTNLFGFHSSLKQSPTSVWKVTPVQCRLDSWRSVH